MFRNLSEKVAEMLIRSNAIPREEKEIYKYGVQQGSICFLNLLTTFFVGLFLGTVPESILFMTAYIPLRSFAGGYHAKTSGRCYFLSNVMMIAILWVIRCGLYSALICSCLMVGSSSIIYCLAPVEDNNKPLDSLEKVVYRKRTRKILLLEIIVAFVSILLKWKYIALCMTLVLSVMAFMLVLGHWKNVYVGRFISHKCLGTAQRE